MHLPVFKLEDYLSTREFRAPFMMGGSDAESLSLKEILGMADADDLALWEGLQLHYTEPLGRPALLAQIADLYAEPIQDTAILSFAGAEEGIYCMFHALLEQGDHTIVITPCYESLKNIPASLCAVTHLELHEDKDWQLDIDELKSCIQPNTKLIVVNFPHNPTGSTLTHAQQKALVEVARENGIWIFSDEVYRYLEIDPRDRLPAIADVYEKGMSLSVLSKAFGMPGLRIGWIACQNTEILHRMGNIKHYLSICNSAPSEILSIIALKSKQEILSRNMAIIRSNIALVDHYFAEKAGLFEWVRPKGGCIGFPRLKSKLPAEVFAEKLLDEEGVVILPNTIFDVSANTFRIGFGRQNFPQAFARFQAFVARHDNIM